jgi:hypothetical protein
MEEINNVGVVARNTTFMRNKRKLCLATVLAAAAVISQQARGSVILPYTLDLSSSDNGSSATLTTETRVLKQFPQDSAGSFEFNGGPIPLDQGGASLDSFTLGMVGDPSVTVNWTVTAGNVPLTFTINGPVVPVGLVNPVGTVSAGITLTDRNGNGATLTGGFAGGMAYQATAGGVFATLDPSFTAAPHTTAIETGNTGPTTIVGLVPNMTASFTFTLSAHDSASGTSFFEILPGAVPESGGALALLLLSGLSLFALNGKLSVRLN